MEEEKLNNVPNVINANLCDSEFFGAVMKSREAYECVLSILMDEPELKLKSVRVEDPIYNEEGQRAVRLDTYALEVVDRQFNTEMQNDTAHDDIMKRSRYYQSLMDSHILKAGPKRYKDMRDTVIIFITQKDIFGKDIAEYVCRPEFESHSDIAVSDGTKRIFFNMESLNGREELVSLLQYMKKTDINNPYVTSRDERIQTSRDERILKLDRIVNEVRQSTEWEENSMSIYVRSREEGRQEIIMRIINNIVNRSDETDVDQIADQLQVIMKIDHQTAKSYVETYNNKNLQSV